MGRYVKQIKISNNIDIKLKKIAILINSMEGGGAERVVSVLLNSWVGKYECHLILIYPNIFYKLDSRINIIHLNEDSCESGVKKLLRLPLVAKKLSNVVKERNFNKVVSFLSRANYINILSSYISKHSTIISERAMPSLQYSYGLNGKINKFLIIFLYHKAKKFTPWNTYNVQNFGLSYWVRPLAFPRLAVGRA